MDAPLITPGELLCLGSSLAFSGLFYYLYRKKTRVVARIQVALSLRCSQPPLSCRPEPLIWVHLTDDCSLLHLLLMSRCLGPSRSHPARDPHKAMYDPPASPSGPAQVHSQSLLL